MVMINTTADANYSGNYLLLLTYTHCLSPRYGTMTERVDNFGGSPNYVSDSLDIETY